MNALTAIVAEDEDEFASPLYDGSTLDEIDAAPSWLWEFDHFLKINVARERAESSMLFGAILGARTRRKNAAAGQPRARDNSFMFGRSDADRAKISLRMRQRHAERRASETPEQREARRARMSEAVKRGLARRKAQNVKRT